MEEIIEALQNLFEFIETAWNFFVNIVKGLFMALGYLIAIIPKITTLIATLPSWLIAFAEITLAVSIGYFIINRKTGKSR